MLFPGTIADNLRLGQFAVTEKRIWESLECVLAAEEIRKLPQGLGTLVSPLNHPFSPELLQKLMIARAILMDCAIYLIGDLTAGFSHETEREILRRLRRAVAIQNLSVPVSALAGFKPLRPDLPTAAERNCAGG